MSFFPFPVQLLRLSVVLELEADLGRHTVIPPRGYDVVGVAGTCGERIEGLGLIISQ